MLAKVLVAYSTVVTTLLAAYTLAGYGASSQFVQLAGVQDSKNHIVGLTLSETEPTGNRRRLFIGHDKEGSPASR